MYILYNLSLSLFKKKKKEDRMLIKKGMLHAINNLRKNGDVVGLGSPPVWVGTTWYNGVQWPLDPYPMAQAFPHVYLCIKKFKLWRNLSHWMWIP